MSDSKKVREVAAAKEWCELHGAAPADGHASDAEDAAPAKKRKHSSDSEEASHKHKKVSGGEGPAAAQALAAGQRPGRAAGPPP